MVHYNGHFLFEDFWPNLNFPLEHFKNDYRRHYLLFHDIIQTGAGGGGGGGGHSKKFPTWVLVLFFGFEICQIVIFWVAHNEGYFGGIEKLALFFVVNWKFSLFLGPAEKINFRAESQK